MVASCGIVTSCSTLGVAPLAPTLGALALRLVAMRYVLGASV